MTKNVRPPARPWVALAVAGVVASCGGAPEKAEIVLCSGSTVTVRGDATVLTVGASSITTRSYRVADFDFVADLIPRWHRWNGNHGLYRPASGGKSHVVLEEGQQFFSNADDLEAWVGWAKRWGGELRYTSDGLLVRWAIRRRAQEGEGPERSLNVDVVQLMLRGEKPRALAGASDAAFRIENPDPACTVGEAMHSDFVAREPATVGGRAYSGWALDVMRAHRIEPAEVERAIARNRGTTLEGITTYEYVPGEDPDRKSGFKVQLDPAGKVILVFL